MDWLTATYRGVPIVHAVVLALVCALQIRNVVRLQAAAGSGEPAPDRALVLGRRVGAGSTALVALVLAALALAGYELALIAISAGLLVASIRAGMDFARGFLQGYQESSGRNSPILASLVAALYVACTGVLTVFTLYASRPDA